MSVKKKDDKNRWRNKMIAFRMSPEEAEQMDKRISLSGLSKQEYLIKRVLQEEIIVHGNPRVYKALRNRLSEVHIELCRLERIGEAQDDLIALIGHIAVILDGLKGGE